MRLSDERIEELRRLEHAGYVGGTRTKIADVLDTIYALKQERDSALRAEELLVARAVLAETEFWTTHGLDALRSTERKRLEDNRARVAELEGKP